MQLAVVWSQLRAQSSPQVRLPAHNSCMGQNPPPLHFVPQPGPSQPCAPLLPCLRAADRAVAGVSLCDITVWEASGLLPPPRLSPKQLQVRQEIRSWFMFSFSARTRYLARLRCRCMLSKAAAAPIPAQGPCSVCSLRQPGFAPAAALWLPRRGGGAGRFGPPACTCRRGGFVPVEVQLASPRPAPPAHSRATLPPAV